VRPGAVIPVGAVDDRPDYDYVRGVTLHVYGADELADGQSVTTVIPAANGGDAATFVTTRRGSVIRVSASADGEWGVFVPGVTPERIAADGRVLELPGFVPD
ncbi:MAG TPA: hypothetical protein VFB06_31380, partial [Streptosporangiaceae bacterium]|nr:hypothetical protein [Streptosporangiaceae bacterium]